MIGKKYVFSHQKANKIKILFIVNYMRLNFFKVIVMPAHDKHRLGFASSSLSCGHSNLYYFTIIIMRDGFSVRYLEK